MKFLSKLIRRSDKVPAGIKYLPVQQQREALARKHAAIDDTTGYPFWKPTQAQIDAGATGAFSLWQFVTAILNQLRLGSCTANGWAGAVALKYAQKTGTPQWLSRLFIYFYERLGNGTTQEDAGAEVSDGADVLSTRGAPPESEYPYTDNQTTFKQQPPASLDASAAQHKIVNPMRVQPTIAHIRAALKAGYAVVYGFMVYASFESDSTTRTGVVTMPARGEEVLGGHCMYFIGYTDASGKAHYYLLRHKVLYGLRGLVRTLVSPVLMASHALRRVTGLTVLAVNPPSDCLIGVNSWGDGVGDKGRYYFPNSFVQKYASDFYIFEDVTTA